MSGHAGAVRAVAFSADGGRIFSGGLDHTVRTWDTFAQKPIGHAVDVGSEITSLAVSSDNRRVATADAKGGVHLFDPSADNAGDRLPTSSQNWASGKNSLFTVAFSPDGLRLIAGGMDGVIHVWGVDDRTHLGEAHGHTGWITSLAFSRDGRRVASSSHDGTVRIWNVGKHRSGGYQIFGPGSPDGAAPFARSVSMSPDSRHLAAGYQDGSLWIFDTDTGRQAIPPMKSDGGTVETSQFGPDGHYIASAAIDRKVRVWDAGTGQRIAESRPAHTATIVQLIFSPDGSHLLSTSEDTTQLWDIKSQPFVGAPLDGAEQYFGNIAFSPDGRLIAGGAKDHSIRVWNANTGEPVRQPLTGHADTISRVAFSPDGHRMVSISPDSLRLWDTSSWQPVGKPHRNTNIFASLAVSPTGDFFVTGGLGSIQRWNMNTGEPIGEPMPGHQGGVGDLAVTGDGKFIISGSMDSTLRFWDSKSGSPVGDPLTADSQSIATLTVRSDRRILSMDINLSADQTVSAWVWPAPAAWHDDLCKKLSYNMSDDQWALWVSPDIKYREVCEALTKLDGGH
jgi:WD40 repeat protein